MKSTYRYRRGNAADKRDDSRKRLLYILGVATAIVVVLVIATSIT